MFMFVVMLKAWPEMSTELSTPLCKSRYYYLYFNKNVTLA